MKMILLALAILFSAGTTFAQTKLHPEHHRHAPAKKYTCSMHPEVIRSKPGKCPKCGMKLVSIKKTKTMGIQAEKPMREVKM